MLTKNILHIYRSYNIYDISLFQTAVTNINTIPIIKAIARSRDVSFTQYLHESQTQVQTR